MADFDPNLAFRTGLLNNNTSSSGGGGGGATGGDGLANKVETPEIIVKAADKMLGTGAKLIGSAVPVPVNFGEVSAFQQFETPQGSDFGSKAINQGAANLSMRGGPLYHMLAPLLADGTVKDHFSLPSGGSSFLDSGGFVATSEHFAVHAHEPMDIGGSGNFAALGTLSSPLPMDTPVISAGRGEGASVA